MGVQMSWKGLGGQTARKPICLRTWSCFVNVVVAECWGWWGGVREGLEQVGELCRHEGELCRQQRGSLIRTDPKI